MVENRLKGGCGVPKRRVAMDVMEAIKTRRSIRCYKKDRVPREVLEQIMEAATYGVSWGNSQPWEFAVVGGEVMEEIRESLHCKTMAEFVPDILYPTFSCVYQERVDEISRQIWKAFGWSADCDADREKMMAIMRRSYDSPNMIVVLKDRSLSTLSLLDIGTAIQSIMLAAHAQGLGTCVLAAVAGYPGDLRRILNIPESKEIIVGISLGYPEVGVPQNALQRQRVPVKNMTSWHGCD
jgi:nitroreductase